MNGDDYEEEQQPEPEERLRWDGSVIAGIVFAVILLLAFIFSK